MFKVASFHIWHLMTGELWDPLLSHVAWVSSYGSWIVKLEKWKLSILLWMKTGSLIIALLLHSIGYVKSQDIPPLDSVSVQSLSCVRLFVTPWTAAHQASLSITNSWSLLKPMSIASVMPSNHLILCHPLLLPSIFPNIRVFSNESALCIRWPKYWSFSFNISPSNEHPGLISFRMDWLDLLAVQGTLKNLLQHHHSKASNLRRSAFLIVQLSHPYKTTEKTIALTRWAFVDKVMSLLLNMLSRLVVTIASYMSCNFNMAFNMEHC